MITRPTRGVEDSRSLVRDVAPFVALTFTISWGLWAVALVLGGNIADPAVFACYVLGALGPSLSAGILRLSGRPGGRQAQWAAAAGWLPAAVLLGAGPAVVAVSAAPLFGAAAADPGVLLVAVAGAGGLLPYLALHLVAGPLAEEFGWRGYLQPRLRRRLTPARTAAVLGTLWALWHVPLFLLVGTVQSQMGLFTPVALGFFAAMLPLSVGYWFVSERLRGGVPAAVLMHMSGNIALTLIFAAPSVAVGACYLGAVLVIAALLLRVGPGPASARRATMAG
ncbi:CPBP family glutamic-type intramembrane protease [Pseudonocardia xinjiangensis]|uniref:CPBP family glutamic-type intramembrane protease n=1 Tax=Pseudonocardia xinjiangensis TaxID=75289 RepID=UPI003D90DD97